MLCDNTSGSNEAEVVCNQVGCGNDGMDKLLFITECINNIIWCSNLWNAVSDKIEAFKILPVLGWIHYV